MINKNRPTYSEEFKKALRDEVKRQHPQSTANIQQIDMFLKVATGEVLTEWMNNHSAQIEGELEKAVKYYRDAKESEDEVRKISKSIREEIKELNDARTAAGEDVNTLAVINTYRQLIDVGRSRGADGNVAVREAAYITWAMLGGGDTAIMARDYEERSEAPRSNAEFKKYEDTTPFITKRR